MMTKSRQKGMTAISWAIVLALIAFFATIVLRLFPVYLEHFSVTGSLKSLREEPPQPLSPSALHGGLLKRLQVNTVSSVETDDISIEQLGPGSYKVMVEYEVRKPFIYNVDFVVSFEDSVTISSR